MDLESRVIQAGHSEELLENPILKEIHEKIEYKVLNKLKATDNIEDIKLLKAILNINDSYQNMLRQTIQDGKLAEMKIKRRFKKIKV